eukprot:gene18873-22575_t
MSSGGINYRQKWVQDLPPPGGWAPLEYGRQTPKMVSGYKIFGATLFIMSVGTYVYMKARIQELFLGSSHENVYLTRWMPPSINRVGAYKMIPRQWLEKSDSNHH